jgi:hypothetical protein
MRRELRELLVDSVSSSREFEKAEKIYIKLWIKNVKDRTNEPDNYHGLTSQQLMLCWTSHFALSEVDAVVRPITDAFFEGSCKPSEVSAFTSSRCALFLMNVACLIKVEIGFGRGYFRIRQAKFVESRQRQLFFRLRHSARIYLYQAGYSCDG